MSRPVTIEVCLRVRVDHRVYLVRYDGAAPQTIAAESPFGGEMWRLPVQDLPRNAGHEAALRAAEAFVGQFRLPAVAS